MALFYDHVWKEIDNNNNVHADNLIKITTYIPYFIIIAGYLI